MDYHGLIKSLQLPDGYAAPTELSYDDIRAHAISRADNDVDVRGINASIEIIRRTRGGNWPTGPVTSDYNDVDEVWHECEFRDGGSFTYAVYDSSGQYLGCAYLSPLGRRTPLTADLLRYDVDVSWWVTPTAYEQGYYTKLYNALQDWVSRAFPFRAAYYSNIEIPSQSSAHAPDGTRG
jgi:RimJ/RimL family protein N-acetyltransferase